MSTTPRRGWRVWSSALLLVAAANPLLGDWMATSLANPVVERFDQSTTGYSLDAWSITQNPRTGTIWIGTANGLLFSFDGLAWESHSFSTGTNYIRALHVDAEDVLWFGAADDLGYFTRRADGRIELRSLRHLVPTDELPLADIYRCHRSGGVTDFVATGKVLRWDGERFQVWRFPTSTRLFPVIFEDQLWFHHLETGLYRLTARGPELAYPAHAMPARGTMALRRDAQGLIAISGGTGFVRIGATDTNLLTEPALEFTRRNLISSAFELPGGFFAVGTLHGGLGIISPHGELALVVDTSSGLPATSIYDSIIDREGFIWTVSAAGVARLPGSTAVTRVKFGSSTRLSVNALAEAQGRLWAATDDALFELHERTPPDPLPSALRVDLLYRSAMAFDDGVLVGRKGVIEHYAHGQLAPVIEIAPTSDPLQLLPSVRDDECYVVESYGLGRLSRRAGQWTYRPVLNLPSTPTSVATARDGQIWAALFRGGARRIDLASGHHADLTPPELHESIARELSFVIPRADGGAIFFFGAHLYSANTDGAMKASTLRLPGHVTFAARSATSSALYVAFQRPTASKAPRGLAIVECDDTGEPVRVRDLRVPSLQTAGRIERMLVRDEDGDAVWIAGSEGLLRVRPEQLETWRPTSPPLLDRVTVGAASPDDPATFTHADHRIAISLGLRENSQRAHTLFQTRLGRDENDDWSAPSERSSFEFSNLSEGVYTFAARAVNPAGQVSEVARYTFRILPPWYRSPWAYGGYFAGAVLAIVGLTLYRERRTRKRTRELETLVRERTAELEKASAAKDEFLASISHEIRNPMNGVVGLSAAIDITPLDSEGRRRFNLLRHCAAHLSTLLEDILDFSRLQSGHVELQPHVFSVTELLESVRAITAADSAAANIPVETAVSSTVPPELIGDARRLRQILLNFVGNGLKYAGRGKIELTVWSRPAVNGGHDVTFAVSDDGPGIPAADHERIFQQFERGRSVRTARIAGTGMGLAVCRTLAEKMGGRVWVESEPPAGATFYLALPLAAAPIASVPASAPTADLRAVLKWALVVDDEEYNCIALAALLEQIGFRVRTESSSLDAVRVAGEQTFDVVFLDYEMPGLNGPALARRLRELHHARGDQPILIATTAYTTEEKRRECERAGMDAFLAKPITPERIGQALRQALQERSPAGVHHGMVEPLPADRLDNLRLVAAKRGRDIAEEAASFAAECERELIELATAIDTEHSRNAAASAHRLAGRLAFVHARTASHLATKLEQCCLAYEWHQARPLHAELARHWSELRGEFTLRPSAPAE